MFFRRSSLVAALLFFFSAALQYNDPDPIQWMAIYVAAGVVSLLAARRGDRMVWYVPALIGFAALLWGLTIAPALAWNPMRHMFDSWEMKNVVIEENRESLGLFIVTAWMVIVTIACARRSPQAAPTSRAGEAAPTP